MKKKIKIAFGFIGFALMFFLGANAVFAKEKVKITFPLGGEQWYWDETYKIKWQADDSVKSVMAYVYNEESKKGSGYINYITPNGEPISAKSGSYPWTIQKSLLPAYDGDPARHDYYIRIDGLNRDGNVITSTHSPKSFSIKDPVYKTQDSTFKVTYENENFGKELKIVSPIGGEIWENNGSYTITWQAGEKIKSVNIYIYDSRIEGSGNVNYITPNGDAIPAKNGSYTWKINPQLLPKPANGLKPDNYQIRIDGFDQNGNILNSVFSSHFEISEPIVYANKVEEVNTIQEAQSPATANNQSDVPSAKTGNPLQNWWHGVVTFVKQLFLFAKKTQAPAEQPVSVQQSTAAPVEQKQVGKQETQPMAKATKDASAIPADWKTYTNTKFNFEFKYPSDATVIERTGTGIFVLLKGQVIKQTGNYIFNLSPPFKNGNTLDVYKNAWLEGDSGTFTSETLAGNDAWKITGAYQNSKNESAKNLTYHYFLKNDYAYLFAIENGTTGEQILSTFKFTK